MLTIFPVENDPQKLLHKKIKRDIRQHSSNKYFELTQIFKPRKSRERSIMEGEESFEATKSVSEGKNEELELDEDVNEGLNEDLKFSTRIKFNEKIKKNKQACNPKEENQPKKAKEGSKHSKSVIKIDNKSIRSPTPTPSKSPESPLSPRPKSSPFLTHRTHCVHKDAPLIHG
jgi:hypothetical protein